MANMSYCRFENTYSYLADYVEALEDCEELSDKERIYAKWMRDMCEKYISAYNKMFEM